MHLRASRLENVLDSFCRRTTIAGDKWEPNQITRGWAVRWFAKRRRAMLIAWSLVLVSIGSLVYGFANIDSREIAPVAIGLAFPLFLIGAIYGLLAARMVTPKKIDDNYVWLRGVHPSFLATLPEWPYGM